MRISQEQRKEIARRCKDGEDKKALAKEFHVTLKKVKQIDYDMNKYVPLRG